MSQVAARRRRKQAANAFAHLDEKSRPKYKKKAATALQRRLQQQIEKERTMQQRKGAKKND